MHALLMGAWAGAPCTRAGTKSTVGGRGDLHTCDLNMPLFVQEDAGRKGRKTDALRRDMGEGTWTPGDPPRPRGAVSMPDRGCLLASRPLRLWSAASAGLGAHRPSVYGAEGTPVSLYLFTRLAGDGRSETFSSPGGRFAPPPQDCLPCENRAGMGQECLSCADTEPLRDLLSPGGRWLAGAHSFSPDLPGSPVLALGTSPELQGNP